MCGADAIARSGGFASSGPDLSAVPSAGGHLDLAAREHCAARSGRTWRLRATHGRGALVTRGSARAAAARGVSLSALGLAPLDTEVEVAMRRAPAWRPARRERACARRHRRRARLHPTRKVARGRHEQRLPDAQAAIATARQVDQTSIRIRAWHEHGESGTTTVTKTRDKTEQSSGFPSDWPNTARSIQNAEGSILDCFVRTIFGWRPSWGTWVGLEGMAAVEAAIEAAIWKKDEPRGDFNGTLSHVKTPHGDITLTAGKSGVSWVWT